MEPDLILLHCNTILAMIKVTGSARAQSDMLHWDPGSLLCFAGAAVVNADDALVPFE
jgi:hypothetical protein